MELLAITIIRKFALELYFSLSQISTLCSNVVSMARRRGNRKSLFYFSVSDPSFFVLSKPCAVGWPFHTWNGSRYANRITTFSLFDGYSDTARSVLRTPLASIDHTSVQLSDLDASPKRKCYSGKVEPDVQHLLHDMTKFLSGLVEQPPNLYELLENFQSSLQISFPSDAASERGRKAVGFRSCVDPTKDNDSSSHTDQFCIDPSKGFLQYNNIVEHVKMTYSVEELKELLAFCKACEADLHLFSERPGEPMLMAPNYYFHDGSVSNFDAMLLLAKQLLLCSQNSDAKVGGKPKKQNRQAQSKKDIHARDKAKTQQQSQSSKEEESIHEVEKVFNFSLKPILISYDFLNVID
ncbi:hypothetical protein EUTSA_v10022144mg [Eutrema salsugineum]|uniref:Uncharacterized protein n=1 Tax=Eutrema salsugineum TaxID=72664 RepID=V4NSA1_EUTSA|nr:hypothetical protein EUTSA_v10022144mg [Eutrema salsugineum]